MQLTQYTSYADAHRYYAKEKLWELFSGDRTSLNITRECIDRHRGKGNAVRIAYADGRDEAYSFDQLSDWSSQFAHRLTRLGVVPGERVAILLEPSLAFYIGLFGAMKAGAVAVPMFTLFGRDALAMRLDDCAPKVLLTNAEKAPLATNRTDLQVLVADDSFIDWLADEPVEFVATTGASDMAMYQYTSGTTRELPEAVKHRHRAVVTVMIAALYASGIRPGDRFCCPSSPAWGHGLWHGTLGPLALGVSITAWSGQFDPARMCQVLQDYQINNLSAAATHYRLIKNSGVAGDFQYCLDKLSFTGEPIDSDTSEFVARTFGTAARSMYGTTEVGVILGGYPGAADLPAKPGSLGKPVPGVEVKVLDGSGAISPPGQIGEIVVRRGDGWFPTKDLGYVDDEGFFYHAGRADDVIISAGWTMSAVEIEDALLKHADVDEVAVIGVPDELRGQVVKAFVVTRRAPDEPFVAEIQDFARERLGSHEYPRRVVFVSDLPKTPAGKVNRKVLRDRERNAST
ncbi:MAG: acyl-CoA synthetase [Gammaproteobacteria bacterium]|nr:acyl-CoA synthetase [Gammaproteobacteria bacterium]